MDGWVKIHKKILDWGRYSDLNTRATFLHCILKANYEDKQRQGQTIGRGSFVSSIGKLSDEVGITRKQMLLVLERLEKSGELVTKRDNKRTTFLIVKYGDYQDKENKKGQQRDNKGITKEHQRDTTKEYKNIRNKENNDNIEQKKILLQLVEYWNKKILISDYKIKDFKQLPKVNIITNNLKDAFKVKYKLVGKEAIALGINNYCKDIESRKQDDKGYYNHRFDLYTFLYQSNGLLKFINK